MAKCTSDTDKDGVGDGRELAINTNPLVADKRVRISLVSVFVRAISEHPAGRNAQGPIWGRGEWAGRVELEIANQTITLMQLSDLNGTDEGGTYFPNNASTEIVTSPGRSATVRSVGVQERDTSNVDSDSLDNFSETLNSFENRTFEHTSKFSGGRVEGDSELIFTFRIEVLG